MLLWIPNNNNALVLRSAQPSPPHPRFASALTLRAPARAPSRLAAMAEPKRAKLGSKASPSAPAVATAALAPSSSSLTESVVPPSSRPAPACVSHEVVDSFAVPGIVLTDHLFRVPLDYSLGPEGGTIQLFARVATSPSRAAAANAAAAAAAKAAAATTATMTATATTSSSATAAAAVPPPPPDDGGPWLLYLQGGPGFEAPRPTEASSWLKAALHHGFRVVLLDQRGTGRSSPPIAPLAHGFGGDESSPTLSSSSSSSLVAACGSEDPEVQARYLACFRADSIVDDAEAVRAALVPATGSPQRGRWSVLGQSFGGFVSVTYLCRAPWGLTEVLLTGGLPPDAAGWEEEEQQEQEEKASRSSTADRVYDALFDRVVCQNAKYYKRYPRDAARVRSIVLALAALPGGGASLPSGGILTPRGLQLLGLAGLGSGGGFDRLHYLLERALCPVTGKITSGFLKGYESWMAWESNPLYALLHESIYCDGRASGRSGWAAEGARQRGEVTVAVPVRNSATLPTSNGSGGGKAAAAAAAAVSSTTSITKTVTLPRPEAFDALAAARQGREVLFTGEMVFPWMFAEVGALKPLAAVAEKLAMKEDWPRLYDLAALRACRVPVAAAVYWEDMYVDFELSQRTAKRLPSLRQWVTSELMHSGIRDDGGRVFEHLMGLVRGSTPLF